MTTKLHMEVNPDSDKVVRITTYRKPGEEPLFLTIFEEISEEEFPKYEEFVSKKGVFSDEVFIKAGGNENG